VNSNDQKLVFQIVEAALEAEGDNFDPVVASEVLPRLRDLGFVEADGSRPSEAAYSEYFCSFELLTPPKLVDDWARALFRPTIYWRKPIGEMRTLMAPQHRGRSFPQLATAFIGKHADIVTWFHELGHIVYTRLDKYERAAFAPCVHEHGLIFTSDGTQPAIDAGTSAHVSLPPEKYLAIGGRLLGLDHSGTDEDAVNDECWAAIFGLGFANVPVPTPVADVFETIIERLKEEIARQR
jgi:hypothetical protein